MGDGVAAVPAALPAAAQLPESGSSTDEESELSSTEEEEEPTEVEPELSSTEEEEELSSTKMEPELSSTEEARGRWASYKGTGRRF